MLLSVSVLPWMLRLFRSPRPHALNALNAPVRCVRSLGIFLYLRSEMNDGSPSDSGFLCTFGVKSTKTIRISLSRDRRSAALKRAPDAGLQANRPRFLTLCLRSVLFPLQAIMRTTHAANSGE